MKFFTSLTPVTKKKIILEIVTSVTELTNEDVEQGLYEMASIIDEIFISVIKTSCLDVDGRNIRIVVLSKHLGASIITDDYVQELLFTEPNKREQAIILALALLSNKKKTKEMIERFS